MTPTEYEKAVLQFFRTHWPPPKFEIKHNIRLLGRKTKIRRQIDAGIFWAGQSEPLMIVEAKRHNRAVDAGIAGATIALVQDVGAISTVMVSTSGFSVAAKRAGGMTRRGAGTPIRGASIRALQQSRR